MDDEDYDIPDEDDNGEDGEEYEDTDAGESCNNRE